MACATMDGPCSACYRSQTDMEMVSQEGRVSEENGSQLNQFREQEAHLICVDP